MKIQGKKYEVMKDAFTKIFNSHGPEKVKEAIRNNGKTKVIWSIWTRAADQLRYNDNHPIIKTRIVQQNTEFDVYDDNTNDDHIQSALVKILKELLPN